MKRKILAVAMSIGLLAGCVAQPSATDAPLSTPAQMPATGSLAQNTPAEAESTQENWMRVNAREYLSLRAQPDTKADRLKKLLPGAQVHVLDWQGEFAHVVDEAGDSGYVLASYLVEGGEAPLEPKSEQALPSGRCVVRAEEYLSLRAQPDSSSEPLRKLPAGDIVTVLSIEGNYARVETQQGDTGYVLHHYLGAENVPAATTPPPPDAPNSLVTELYVVVNVTNYLSMRAEPDGQAERLKKLYPGTRVSRLEEDGAFAYVEEEGTGDRGYVLSSRLIPVDSYTPPQESASYWYADVEEYLSLRATPSTNAERIAKVMPGERVERLALQDEFAKVRTGGGLEGYVLEAYLTKEKPQAPKKSDGSYRVLAKEYLTLRESPSSSAKAVAKVPAGSSVKLLGYDGLYAHIAADGEQGYVLSGYLAPAETDPYLKKLSIVTPVETYTHTQMQSDIQSLKTAYSIRVESIGKSVNGLDIPVLVLGNRNAEHHVLVQASIHGREHMTALLVMAQIESLLRTPEGTFDGVRYQDLLQSVCLHVIPMANPDGVAISQQAKGSAITEACYASDTQSGYTDLFYEEYLRAWKANANGVDLNRNFNAGWSSLDSRKNPSSSHYKGASPADQPEAAALAAYAKRYDFDATISYHAYGSMLYWEYPADKAVREQSNSLAKAVRALTRYPLISSQGVDSGGFKDWAMASRSIPSITIEIGSRECPLPLDEFSSIWERNRQVLPAICAWALKQGSEGATRASGGSLS